MTPIEVVLTLWQYGHMNESEVTDWAWKQVAVLDAPSYELLELANDGPVRCLKRAEADFSPRPVKLTYEQEFALRAIRTIQDPDASLLDLARWAAKAAMGEELESPLVELGYLWDHLLYDCEDTMAALESAQASLPLHLHRCRAIAAPFTASGA